MASDVNFMNLLLGFLVELLDIPPSSYEKATDRYKSLADWLHRKESKVVRLSPEVYLQGSFRYGTVIRPLFEMEEYDLDLVCQMVLSKGDVTQREVKHLVGEEIKAYAEANSFNEPAEEKPRCWRLNYADGVKFHMDILPCVPEDASSIEQLCKLGAVKEFAALAVAITDRRHPKYAVINRAWPSSSPRGIAAWFERCMRPVARPRILELVENRAYASVDAVPSYEWKTPLQRCIQILKRHRDVLFKDSPEWKPLSMIITTLATHAYNREGELYEALTNIVEGMPNHIRATRPRIPNPVNPAEDFADRWATDARYEENFKIWRTQVKADLLSFPTLIGGTADIIEKIRRKFAVNLTGDMQKKLNATCAVPGAHILTRVPAVHIASAPKPWRRDA